MTRFAKRSCTLVAMAANMDAANWPSLFRYGTTLLAVGALALLRLHLPLDSTPYLLFMPGMFVIGFLFGRGPGFFATALTAFIVAYSFMTRGHLAALTHDELTGTVAYVVISLGLTAVCDLLRRTLARHRSDLLEVNAANLSLRQSRAALEESEGFLRSVLQSSPDCIKILDLDSRLTFMSEGGQQVMEVNDFSRIEGCPWPDFWQGEGNAAAKAAISEARAGRTARFQGFCPTVAGSPRWWDVVVAPVFGADGKPEKILSISRDVTDIKLVDMERMKLASLIEQSTDFIAMADPQGKVFFLNEAALEMVGLARGDVSQNHMTDYFAPGDRDTVANTIMPALAETGKWEGELRLRNFQTGQDIPVLYNIFPVRDPAGTLLGYGTVTKDVTAQKRAEAQQQLLNHELGHRLKNTLAMVQAIANQTLRRANSLPEARAAFDARLIALGKAQDVLTGGKWESAEISAVVRNALSPHGVEGRFEIEGPRLMLSARCALALSLALHELATNAAKYGALSNETGRIRIAWRVEHGEHGLRFQLEWAERGGPPVKSPERSGFGSFMIERSLAGYFRGTARMEYAPAGALFHLQGPATASESEFLSGDVEILAANR